MTAPAAPPRQVCSRHFRIQNRAKTLDEPLVEQPLPRWIGSDLGLVRVDLIPVVLTATCIHVHVNSPQPGLALPQVANDPEDYDDRQSKHGAEEVLGGTIALLTGWADSAVHLHAGESLVNGF